MRVPDEKGGWKIRVFQNKFPAVKMEGDFNIKTHNDFYTFATAYGQHEVIVETPDESGAQARVGPSAPGDRPANL